MLSSQIDSDFTEDTVCVADGLHLSARIYEPARLTSALAVICLAGLSRNARDFHALALILSRHPVSPCRVIAIDMRGRGRSDRDPDPRRYTVAVEAGDVAAVCAALQIDRAIFIGTSRGGLILHVLAGLRPDLIAGVLLNDIGPVIERDGLMRIGQYLSETSRITTWSMAAERLRRVHGLHFPALKADDWAEMAQAIYCETPDGIIADFDPEIGAPLAGITQETPLPALWDSFDRFAAMPLMVIRGEHSDILSAATVKVMQARHSGMIAITAQGQGHAPLLHKDELCPAIHAFIDSIEQ